MDEIQVDDKQLCQQSCTFASTKMQTSRLCQPIELKTFFYQSNNLEKERQREQAANLFHLLCKYASMHAPDYTILEL